MLTHEENTADDAAEESVELDPEMEAMLDRAEDDARREWEGSRW